MAGPTAMRLSSVLALLQPALPLILGLSLGCSLSLLRVSWIQGEGEDPCVVAVGEPGGPQNLDSGAQLDQSDEDFKPRIVPYYRDPNKPYKKVLRTRYIQTELGSRERLLVAVLTSRATLSTLAVAVNRTVAHHFPRLLYFTGQRGARTPAGMQVVSHGDERPAWLMSETLRHLHTHFGADYDWFFVMQDDTYVQAPRLAALAGHLSINQDLYLGRTEEFIGAGEQARYCHGGFGYLLSRSLLLRLWPHLDGCRGDILSARPDEWLGRCLIDSLGIGCVSQHQAQIRNLTVLTPEGEAGLSWPIGLPAPFTPHSRFEVLGWDYFTEQHTFSCADGAPKCPLQGASRADVGDAVETALEQLNRRYQPRLRFQKQRLLNGYRRFDPARGMEYTLDLLLEAVTQRGHRRALARRVSLLRPLSRVEILPMPYVTEATRVQLVLPLLVAEAAAAPAFLEAFAAGVLEPREHALLTLLLVYGPREGGRGAPDPFLGVKAAAAELERRYPGTRLAWLAVRAEAPSQVRLLDVVSKKHPVDTLFFLATVWTRPGPEVLNRCRMNAISGWQAFFPVHFQEFSPALAPQRSPQGPPGAGPDPPSPPGAEPARGAPVGGRFDRQASAEGCFYNADYLAARARLAGELAGQEEEEALEGLEVMDVFLRFSGLHLFRAVEPGLVQKFSVRDCSPRLSEELYHRCRLSTLEGLGARAQLAVALFEQEQANST
ncbi:chondroitin sulfate glucuronyltransferase isoform X2 [Sagmatias obliquidens]|uniref:Hexosyltransferase n=1 Tax=Tursiops truncatus TaxID=9739 RepID=A0A6J3RXZ9_TURTR|nr:chondroitin sulfate glucuronyltransferase isoform X2 [Lagenorhynchus obliquidens]XP_030710105.1 chondroitin sulfate glucuronyltransferase isoform X2 [Globicephala melas]XP_033719401.1 chondroitin sulfate glucuronyltransferase isoform X2 [Tursiops truncatus]XP_059877121.1 chondroitin sulfate glucuronyltransferase isoform X3 [Delphinus delphis]